PARVRAFYGEVDAFERRPYGLVVDFTTLVDRVRAKQLRLAIKLAERHAERLEKAEGLRAERRATGRRRPQARKAERVTQRSKQQQVGEHRAPFGVLVERRHAEPHARAIGQPLEWRRFHDPRAHVGGDLLPYTRGEKHKRRPDLAHVRHGGLGFFDEVHPHARDQRLAEHIHLLHDPRQRQYRDILVVRPLGIDGEIAFAMPDQPSGRERGALRMSGRPRGGAKDDGFVARRSLHKRLVEPWLLAGELFAEPVELRQWHEARIAVLLHAARVAVNDALHVLQAFPQAEQLVDLLFVLGQDHGGVGEVEQVRRLLIERVPVYAEA